MCEAVTVNIKLWYSFQDAGDDIVEKYLTKKVVDTKLCLPKTVVTCSVRKNNWKGTDTNVFSTLCNAFKSPRS